MRTCAKSMRSIIPCQDDLACSQKCQAKPSPNYQKDARTVWAIIGCQDGHRRARSKELTSNKLHRIYKRPNQPIQRQSSNRQICPHSPIRRAIGGDWMRFHPSNMEILALNVVGKAGTCTRDGGRLCFNMSQVGGRFDLRKLR